MLNILKTMNKWRNKRRAVSPVIAAILLIGLTVLASALMFFIVLPMFNPPPSFEISQSFVEYDDSLTKAENEGWGLVGVTIRNTGQVLVEIGEVKLYYYVGTDTIQLNNTLLLGEDFDDENPLLVSATQSKQVRMNFPLPIENIDETVQYKVEAIPSNPNINLQSTDFGDLSLEKDRPSISIDVDATLRRDVQFEPITSDNSEIKDVTYSFYDSVSQTLETEKIVTSQVKIYNWNWASRQENDFGLPNGSYILNITAADYAGNTATASSSFVLDNDYVDPTIEAFAVVNSTTYDPITDVEVGESALVEANITDSGSAVSEVNYAFIYYKNSNETEWTKVSTQMNYISGDTYRGNIPSAAITSKTWENSLDVKIEAIDDDGQDSETSSQNYGAVDTQTPNIAHTPISTSEAITAIEVTAEITDKEQVDGTTVELYYRYDNDLNANVTTNGLLLPSQWFKLDPTINGDSYTWEIPANNVTIHGVNYYILASDRSGNEANDGTMNDPNQVTIADEYSSTILHTPITSATQDYDVTVYCNIRDNDPSFGANGTKLSPTGTVTLWYADHDASGADVWYSTAMVLDYGNSSIGQETIWKGIIPGDAFQDDEDPSELYYYIVARDQSGNEATKGERGDPIIVPVNSPGEPALKYVANSVNFADDQPTKINFTIYNDAIEGLGASATLVSLNLTMFASPELLANGLPLLNNVSIIEPLSAPKLAWDAPSAVQNKTWVTFNQSSYLSDPVILGAQENCTIELGLINSTDSSSFDAFSMKLGVIINATHQSGTEYLEHQLKKFTTPAAENPYYEPLFDAQLYTGNGHYYVNRWLMTPKYSHAGNDMLWTQEGYNPWADPYPSKDDTASGNEKPYEGMTIPEGFIGAPYDNDAWNYLNLGTGSGAGRQFDIDALGGLTSDAYIWFYAVVIFEGDQPTSGLVGSDDQSILYMNGQQVYSYSSPRAYSEDTYTILDSYLRPAGENNYLLFGVKERGGQWSGGVAFNQPYKIKIYNGPNPVPEALMFKVNSFEVTNLDDLAPRFSVQEIVANFLEILEVQYIFKRI